MASLKDLIVLGPARFLDKLYGNLEGNATTATKLQTARTLTLGNSSINFDGSENKTFNLTVSNAWTGGTTAGPTLSTTVNGVTGTAVAIPSASSAASGVVTIADQSFRGMKTFYGAVRGYMYNLNNNAPAFIFDKPSSHWTGIGACGENDTIFFGPCASDSNAAGGYSWVANYNQKWKFQGDIYTTNLINAGGTITSASTITGNRFVVSSTSAEAHIEFSRGSWNYFKAPSGGLFAFVPNGGGISTTGAKFVIASDAVYPGENNGTVDLGKNSYKWNNVYGNNFSGNAASASWLNMNSALAYGNSGLQYFNLSGTAGTDPQTNNTPTSDWHHIIRMNHNNKNGYFADIAVPLNNVNGIYWRQIRNGTNYGWYTLLDSNNYTSYTVKKDGTGASGTWGISITGSAGSVAWGNVSGKPSFNYLPLAGGTMNAGSQIIRAGQSKSWISGRDGALLRINTLNGYSPAISIKTNNGTWEIGAYDNSSYTDKLIFSFATDTNYNASNNTTSQWMITKDGYFNGSCASANSVTWDNVSGKPSTFTPASHTHSYLSTSGGTLTGALNISYTATPTMDHTSTNPRIVFSEGGTQPVGLVYTDYDSYRSPAGLKVTDMSGSNGNAWFEVQGKIYCEAIASGSWNGSAVGVNYGGTGATDKVNAKKNLGISSGTSLPSSGSTGDIFFLYT